MKVLFICPTNPKYMPYLDNYLKLLNSKNVAVSCIIWDRFKLEEFDDRFIFRRGGSTHKRGFLDYYYFSIFIKNHFLENTYDRVVCFGLQTAFFIKNILCRDYLNRFILDIRDYNMIKKIHNFENIINCSSCTVISSPGYIQWLPNSDKYIVNHNFNFSDLVGMFELNKTSIEKISISSIGALRDLKVNLDLIKFLKHSPSVKLKFHGRGDVNDILKNKTKKYSNVEITGFYEKKIEYDLYAKSSLINVLRYPDSINNITALPNRLYLAPYYAKPLFSFQGTYMSELIKEYDLGLVVNTFDNIEDKIIDYVNNFDDNKFESSRRIFLNKVIKDNLIFENKINGFFFS